MSHQLPELSYSVESLEPHIDARTMEIHHGKHHQTYVNNLNAALESHTALSAKPVEELIADPEQPAPKGLFERSVNAFTSIFD